MNRRDFLLASVAAMAAAGTLRAAPGASMSATRRVRVACFSKTGNTRAVADLIAQALGADVAEIRPAVPYPADYQAAVDRSRAELESGETVAIAPVALGDFDVLFVGSPNWWGTVAPPAATFLRTAPLKGKLVVPFFTHGGGGIQRCGLDASRILEARGARPLPAQTFPGGAATRQTVADWLATLDLAADPLAFADVPRGPFPLGQPNVANVAHFSGRSWVAPLTAMAALNCPIANVTFEPGCRNNWHRHAAGQLLICVSGEGRYQERASYRRPGRVLRPGDVVEIAPGVEHWHGAATGSWFQHLAVSCNPGTNKTEWLEPVADADYLPIGAKAKA